jgi:tetratricopeptide (TPR) repeat protein
MSHFARLISLAQPILWGIAISGLIILSATASWGLSATEVAKIAKGATVRIESNDSQGSGAIIQQQAGQYLVLTAAHVVRGSQVKYALVTSDDLRYQLTPNAIQMLPGVDLAVVKFTSDRRYLVPKLGDANSSTEGTTTYVSGFPSGTEAIDQSIFSFTDGKVTANSSRPLKDGYAIIYSNNTLPGMSGGGVFNDRGELIAIHGKGDVDTKIQTSEINPNVRIKTGFNLGIPINTFQQLSAKIGVDIGGSTIVARSIQPQVDDFILSGFEQVSKSNLAGSIVTFTKAIELNPKLVTPRFWRGACRLLMGEARGAVEDLSAAISLNPKKLEAYMYRGSAYAKLGDRIKAIADLDQALMLSPQSDVVYGNRCGLKFRLRDFTGAIADCDRAIKLSPKTGSHYNSRGSAYYQLNRYSEALADQNIAIKLSPQDKIFHVNRGLAKMSLGDNKGAIIDYNTALKSKHNPQIAAEIYAARARAKKELQDRKGALADYNRAISLFGAASRVENLNLPNAHYDRGLVKVELGDKQGAIVDLRVAAKLYLARKDRQKYQLTLKKIAELQQTN